MRNILFLIVLASLTSEKLVESAECAHLLYRYYSCKNLNFTIEGPTDVDPNEYFNINGKLDDAFFEKKLSPVHSFGSAMNFFRRIYTEMRDCNTDVCRCARQRADGSHFESIFTNSGHFAFLKLLTSQIKVHYNTYKKQQTLRLLKYINLILYKIEQSLLKNFLDDVYTIQFLFKWADSF